MYNFSAILDRNLARCPDKTIIRSAGRALTNRDLHARASSLAAGLRELGIGKGDIVAILMYNHPEFLETIFAVNRIGAVFLPLNYRLAPNEWEYILGHCEAAAVVTEAEFADPVEDLATRLPALRHRLLIGDGPVGSWRGYEDLMRQNAGVTVPVVPCAADDLQRLMYTSGTTSRPKGVRLTHGNFLWKNFGHIMEFGLTDRDATLVCGPLYHVGGLDLPGLATMHVGGSLIIMRKFDARETMRLVERERPTGIWLPPAMMNAILQLPDLSHCDTSSLRYIIGGGEKMPEPLVSRIVAAFPTTWFADAYGLTETVSGDTFNDSEHTLSKVGSVGRPVAHLDVRIVGDNGSELAAGELGEVTLRGPKVFAGYWRDEEATAAAVRDGWFYTGDMGRVDKDGYLYVEDRKKDMIVSGGENIATPEVERVLYENPDVVEAAVVGVPHPRWGEVPKAFVVIRPGADIDEPALREFCRARLAKFKTPAEIQFIDALPRTPSGKVLKRELRHPG